jgi:hypothetical protein
LANPLVQRIEHGVDYRAGNLIIKIHIWLRKNRVF